MKPVLSTTRFVPKAPEFAYVVFSDPIETMCHGVFLDKELALKKANELQEYTVWVEKRKIDVLDFAPVEFYKVKEST